MKVILSALTIVVAAIAGFAAVPAATAHVVECAGNDTEQGICLIACHQTHIVFAGGPHDCYNNNTRPPPPTKVPQIPKCDDLDVAFECRVILVLS